MGSSPMVSAVRFTRPSAVAARTGLVALASFDHGLLRVHNVAIRRQGDGALKVCFPFPDHRAGPGALSRPITETARRAVEADLLAEFVRQGPPAPSFEKDPSELFHPLPGSPAIATEVPHV